MLITNLWISIEDCSKAILHNSWYFVQLVGCPKATFGPRTRRQPHSHLILITAIYQVCPEGHQEPCTKVGSQSLAKCISRIELGTFQFWVWSAIPLHPSPSMVHFQLKKAISPKPQKWFYSWHFFWCLTSMDTFFPFFLMVRI